MAEFNYPSSIKSGKHNYITITQKDNKSGVIKATYNLYMQPEIMVGDSANWSEVDQGIYGALAGNAKNGEELFKNAQQKVGELSKSSENSDIGAVLAKTIGGGTPVGDAAAVILHNKGIATNPHTVLQYKGNSIRQYNFMFKMVPYDEAESQSIKAMCDTLRMGSYGTKSDTAGFLLGYPDLFKITFKTSDGSTNQFLPSIAPCRLQTISVSNNSSGNLYFAGGAPTEVNLSLMFREIRALTREDLTNMNNFDDATWLV